MDVKKAYDAWTTIYQSALKGQQDYYKIREEISLVEAYFEDELVKKPSIEVVRGVPHE